MLSPTGLGTHSRSVILFYFPKSSFSGSKSLFSSVTPEKTYLSHSYLSDPKMCPPSKKQAPHIHWVLFLSIK